MFTGESKAKLQLHQGDIDIDYFFPVISLAISSKDMAELIS